MFGAFSIPAIAMIVMEVVLVIALTAAYVHGLRHRHHH
jgi:hypothetical protein